MVLQLTLIIQFEHTQKPNSDVKRVMYLPANAVHRGHHLNTGVNLKSHHTVSTIHQPPNVNVTRLSV